MKISLADSARCFQNRFVMRLRLTGLVSDILTA
jgi:hypothetical protein